MPILSVLLSKLVDYNDILRFVNKFLGILMGISLIIDSSKVDILNHFRIFGQCQAYVNSITLIIGLVIVFICECILIHEKKEPDPFVLMFMTFIILFFSFRVLTLFYFPLSTVLPRFLQTSVVDINQSLWFILFGIIAIYAGLRAFKTPQFLVCDNDEKQKLMVKKSDISLLFLLTLLTNLFYWVRPYLFGNNPSHMWDRVSNYLTILFNLDLSLLLLLVYLLLYWRELSRSARCMLVSMVLFFLITRTVAGSRSAIMTLSVLCLCAALPVLGRIRVKTKVILVGFAFFILSFPFVIGYSMYIRDINGEMRSRYSFSEYMLDKNHEKSGINLVYRIFDRAGYLDMAVDLITNHGKYAKVINFNYYARSVIDNALTPGISIFEGPKIPKVANVLKHVYSPEDFPMLPTREEVHRKYQADMLTVFGECYVLFNGYLGLLALAGIAYGFKRVYYALALRNEWFKYCYRSIVLFVFYQQWLLSFGLDWIFVDLVKYALFLLVVWFLLAITAGMKERFLGLKSNNHFA